MGALRKILLAAIVLAIAFSYQTYRDLSKPHERPELGEFLEIYARNFQY